MLRIIRTLKVDILTLFLTLNIIAIIAVISVNYVENYIAVTRFSADITARIANATVDRISLISARMVDSLNQLPVNASPGQNFYEKNQAGIDFMFNTLKYNSDISKFFIAAPDGNAVLVSNLQVSNQKFYRMDASKPLPPGSVYVLRVIDLANKATPEVWYYKDKDFNTLASEHLTQITEDLRSRPPYKGALNHEGIYWSDFYSFATTGQSGISAAKAIKDKQGNIVAVVGASLSDLSFEVVSSFLKSTQTGKAGRLLILDPEGEVVVPSVDIMKNYPNAAFVVRVGFKKYIETKKIFFILSDRENKKHILYFASLSKSFGQNWLLAIVAPFGSFFVTLFKAQILIALIAFIVLIISIFIIIGFARRISSPIVTLSNEINKITQLDFEDHVRLNTYIKELQMMDASVATLRTTLRSFTRYVPKEIVKQLLLQGKEITLEGEKKEVTILFSDIQDFTTIAEKNTAETLMALLSEYFDGISKVIIENKGTIDKYIGDAVMAFWGAPVDEVHHAEWACLAALRSQAFLKDFNAKRRSEGKPEFITRFGLNTGNVIVGNLGTLERMNYTMIGDAVNIASRLENLDKVYHVTILISEKVLRQIGKRFLTRHLDIVRVKGKLKKVKVYELVASLHDDGNIKATPTQIDLCKIFDEAYEAFFAKKFDKAKTLFEAIHAKYPEDYPTQLYLQRIKTHFLRPNAE